MRLSLREAAASASQMMLSGGARDGISEARLRQIEAGYQTVRAGVQASTSARADTLAWLARFYGITPEHLEDDGQRPDAADVLRDILRRELMPSAGTPGAPLAPGMSRTQPPSADPYPADGEPSAALRALYEDEPEPGSPEDQGAWTLFPAAEDFALRWLWRTPGATVEEKTALIDVVRKSRSGDVGSPPGESAAG
jgi:hypothetical protein